MEVLLINGSPHPHGNTRAVLEVVANELHAQGIDTRWFQLGTGPIRGCTGCGGCQKTNRCVFDDDPCNQLIESILAADGLVVGSPVYFAGPNGALYALLDRAFYATCTRSQLFHGKPAAALVTQHRVGGSAALDRLHRYFIPCQMPVVTTSDYLSLFRRQDVGEDPRQIDLLHTLARNLAAQLTAHISQ